ncbi:ribonuclease HI [Marivirga sp.]|uniref:ribonuclease HI n=1 Tax=Marivirga sp. TaxID=2018662 RepID=UPI002D80EBC5|nr:RNase H family protein [Marivirga sp.]HET8859597.1 RNase H family protein [Marivirga sp.]
MGVRELFIDGSVNNQLKLGCGAYLVVNENEEFNDQLKLRIKTKLFANTSSTKLELQILLWALSEMIETGSKQMVYTDSQNIVWLKSRRTRLEQNDYHSSNQKLLNHHELYREFFTMMDQRNCDFVKIEGHQPDKNKNYNDQLFTLVDRAARRGLRNTVS